MGEKSHEYTDKVINATRPTGTETQAPKNGTFFLDKFLNHHIVPQFCPRSG